MQNPSEQAVIVEFMATNSKMSISDLFSLENDLKAAIEDAKLGEYDGNEIE